MFRRGALAQHVSREGSHGGAQSRRRDHRGRHRRARRLPRGCASTPTRLVLIEGGPHGTTCARVGCMPSKLLIAAAEAAHAVREAPGFGVHAGAVRIDGRAVMARVRALARPTSSASCSRSSRTSRRTIAWPGTRASSTTTRCRSATTRWSKRDRDRDRHGLAARAIPPSSRELGDRLVINDDVFDWQDLPESVAVFGAGVIGLELGQALHRLGVRVRVFGRGGASDRSAIPKSGTTRRRTFAAEFPLDPDAKVQRRCASGRRGRDRVRRTQGGDERTEHFDYLLAATGPAPQRRPAGPREHRPRARRQRRAGIRPLTAQCGDSHIFIAGDADDDVPLLHEAADEGKIAGDNAGALPGRARRGPARAARHRVHRSADRDRRQVLAGARRPSGVDHAIGEVSFEDQGRSRVMQQEPGPAARLRRPRHRPLPRRRDGRPRGRAHRPPARLGGAAGSRACTRCWRCRSTTR